MKLEQVLEKLISFRSTEDNPTEIERGLKYIASLFDTSIFQIQNYEYNGKFSQLISLKGNDSMHPDILLNGHIDVVPTDEQSQYAIRIESDTVYGRGVSDMKGQVAALILAMQEITTWEEKPNVALLITGDEEVAGENGVGYMVEKVGLRPKFVICTDDSHETGYYLTVKEKGALWLELRFQGKAGHGAYPWEGENALEQAVEGVQKIKELLGPNPKSPNEWKTSVNLARIETVNETPNKIPEQAKVVLDIRFTEETAENPEELLKKIQQQLPAIQVNMISKADSLFGDENNDYVQQFHKTAEQVIGSMVSFRLEHGATDARFFGKVGIPSIIFGAIGGNMHGKEEWVSLKSLELQKATICAFLKTLIAQ